MLFKSNIKKFILKLLILTITTNTYFINTQVQDLPTALKSYNKTKKSKQTRSLLSSLASALFLVARDPNKGKQANLRISKELSKEEQDFLQKRKPKVKASLEKFLNIKLKDSQIPNIAICGSGGGLRAMFSTLGVLTGLEKINLLDSITYFSALSGSTFALSSWMVHQNKAQETQDYLIKELSKNFMSKFEFDEVIKTGIGRVLYGQKISPVNLYGAFLANRLFGDFGKKAYHIKLSETSKAIENGAFPFPIYTAVSTTKIDNKYNWFELNPYEVNFKYNNQDINIPSWSLGRKFKNCKTSSKAPENSLGFIIGICGSAFTISAKELVDMYQNSIPSFLRQSLKFITTQTDLGEARIIPGTIYNPIYKCPITKNTPYETLKNLYLIDAGMDFNLPTHPLLKPERKIDIIIIIDSSGNVAPNAAELRKAENYARVHNLKFPKIDYSKALSKNITVFTDKDTQTPTVIYIPLIKNPSYSDFDPTNFEKNKHLGTFNLRYTKEQSTELCGLTTHTVINHKKLFKDTIISVINKKRRV